MNIHKKGLKTNISGTARTEELKRNKKRESTHFHLSENLIKIIPECQNEPINFGIEDDDKREKLHV